MPTVVRYPLTFDSTLHVPTGAQVLHVAEQAGSGFLWMLVEPGKVYERRRFVRFSDGQAIPFSGLHYVGTSHLPHTARAVHTFEVIAGVTFDHRLREVCGVVASAPPMEDVT